MIVVLVGGSGAGKSTIEKHLGIKRLVSTTTRKPRDGEIEGEDYYFKDREYFQSHFDDFIEYVEYSGNFYGLSKEEASKKLQTDETLVVTMETTGAKSMKKMYGDKVKIVYCNLPMDVLVERMRSRGNTEDEINERVNNYTSDKEYMAVEVADYVLNMSGTIEETIEKIRRFIKKNEKRQATC